MTKDATARTDYPTRWYLVIALIVIGLTSPDVTKADNYYDFLENPIQGECNKYSRFSHTLPFP